MKQLIIQLLAKLVYLESRSRFNFELALVTLNQLISLQYLIIGQNDYGLDQFYLTWVHRFFNPNDAITYFSLLYSLFLLAFLLYYTSKNWKQHINFNFDKFTQIYIQFWSYSHSFNLPIITIFLYNLVTSASYFVQVTNLVSLIFAHLIYGFHYVVAQQKLTKTPHRIKSIQFTLSNYIVHLLYYAQAYFFVLAPHNQYAQPALFLLIALLEFKGIFRDLLYSNISQVQAKLILLSLGTIVSTCMLANLDQYIFYAILLAPITYHNLHMYWLAYIDFLLHANPKRLAGSEVNFLVCIKRNEPQFAMHTLFAFYKHRRACAKLNCFCMESQKIALHSEEFLEQLRDSFLERVVESKKAVQALQGNFYANLHYLQSQSSLGFEAGLLAKLENRFYYQSLNIVHQIQWKVFVYDMKQFLFIDFSWNIQNDTQKQLELTDQVRQFLVYQKENNSMKLKIQDLVQKKAFFLENISQNLPQIPNLISQMENYRNKLEALYEASKLVHYRNILLFYYTEVLNDFLKAQNISTISILQESMQHYQINFGPQEVCYIVFSFENNSMGVKKFSDLTPQLFGYQYKEFQQLTANDLIPSPINLHHQKFVTEFLSSGRGRYFRSKGVNLCKLKSGLIKYIHFFYDVCMDEDQRIHFILFCNEAEYFQGVILLNEKQIIKGVNHEFLMMLGFSDEQIKQINFQEAFEHVSFQQLLVGKQGQKYFIQFPDFDTLQKLVASSYQTKVALLKQPGNFNQYEIELDLIKREGYAIMKIISVTKIDDVLNLGNLVPFQVSQKKMEVEVLPLEEQEVVLVPFDENHIVSDDYKIHVVSSPYITLETRRADNALLIFSSNLDGVQPQSVDQRMYPELDEAQQQMENGSVTSSLKGLRKSPYYKKYCFYNTLSTNQVHGINLLKIVALMILCFTIQLIYFLILYFVVQSYFETTLKFYQTVQINHYFIEPFQKFFLTRYITQGYVFLQVEKKITPQQYTFYLSHTQPNLIKQYEILRQNFQVYFAEDRFQAFFNDQYLQIKQQTVHNTPIQLKTYNTTLRTAFSILLEAFYKQYQFYVNPNQFSVSRFGVNPHNTFQYVNYMIFVTIFDEISETMLTEAVNTYEEQIRQWNLFIYPFFAFIVVLYFVTFYFVYQMLRFMNEVVRLLNLVDVNHVNNETKRLNSILVQLKQSSDFFRQYKFSIEQRELQLERQQGKDIVDNKQYKRQGKKFIWVIHFVPLVILLCIFVMLNVLFDQVTARYLTNFPQTISLFKRLSDIGVYVPAAFSQKEILYFWTFFSYYTNKDREEYMEQIRKGIDKIQAYVSYVPQNSYQFTDEFFDAYEKYKESNLCLLLNATEYVEFDYFCQRSKNGVLKFGLIPALNDFKNQLKSEMELGFKSRASAPLEEMEAIFLCSDAISKLAEMMMNNINKQTRDKQTQYLILMLMTALIIVGLMVVLVYILYPYYAGLIIRLKKISYLVPQETILFSNTFEREFRIIANQQQLI